VIQDLTERLAELKREYARLSTTFNGTIPGKRDPEPADEIAAAIQDQRKALPINHQRLSGAVRREDLAGRRSARSKKIWSGGRRAVQYNILKREVDTNKQLYEGLLQRLKEAGVSPA